MGYQQEARGFKRRVYESLVFASAFAQEEVLAAKFYKGEQIPIKAARRAAAVFLTSATTANGIDAALRKHYVRLSQPEHPSLEAFTLRTARVGVEQQMLSAGVPKGLVYGGFTSDSLMLNAIADLAQTISGVLEWMGFFVGNGDGSWDSDRKDWGAAVEALVEKANGLRDEPSSSE